MTTKKEELEHNRNYSDLTEPLKNFIDSLGLKATENTLNEIVQLTRCYAVTMREEIIKHINDEYYIADIPLQFKVKKVVNKK